MGLFDRLFGRRTDDGRAARADALLDELARLGFFALTPPADVDQAKAEVRASYVDRGIAESEWGADLVSRDRRSYGADAEDLAEGQVTAVLRTLAPAFAQLGAPLDVEDVVADGARCVVRVNGVDRTIYGPDVDEAWQAAFTALLGVGDDLLAQAGATARLYGQYGGNDARVWILDEALVACFDRYGMPADWRPRPRAAYASPST